MKLKRLVTKLLTAMFCIISCSGCKKDANDDLIVYKNFYDQDISTFNYITTNIHTDLTHIANFVDGLVEVDKYGNIVPSIATSWENEIIGGKQIWTFYIRENVYWSDYKGNKHSLVTAHDFVTTLKYSLNHDVASQNYNLPASIIDNALGYYNATLIRNYNYQDVLKKINELEKKNNLSELDTYTKIKSGFEYCQENLCSLDFNNVGVKAINDYKLQFTLTKPIPYFLSTLTYGLFLPSNEDFIKEIGFNNFGTNKMNLLYNGAYILNNYYHSSKIEYVKNNNYWDKDKVYIDKIIFNKLLNYAGVNYSRLSYEMGNINGFYVNSKDTKGWTKYVTGEDNSGSISNPVGNNTYSIDETTDFTTYYLIFNQNRVNKNYTTLSNKEIQNSNIALSNINFRRALVYGLHQEIYSTSYLNEEISTIIPSDFIQNSDKDYHDYFLEEYSIRNNITVDEAISREKENALLFDQDKSSYYLNIALEELSSQGIKLPIKLEFSYFFSQEYKNYDLLRIKQWNNTLNGCDIDASTCNYDKVFITFNDTLSNYNDFDYAVRQEEYSITILGLYPIFMDPTAYLQAFSSTGELATYINQSQESVVDEFLEEINLYYKEEDKEKRFKLSAKLEYEIIFNSALILPFCIKDTTDKVLVTDLVPYEKMKASYGLSPFKFKLRKMRTKDYTQEDIAKLKEEYERGNNKWFYIGLL